MVEFYSKYYICKDLKLETPITKEMLGINSGGKSISMNYAKTKEKVVRKISDDISYHQSKKKFDLSKIKIKNEQVNSHSTINYIVKMTNYMSNEVLEIGCTELKEVEKWSKFAYREAQLDSSTPKNNRSIKEKSSKTAEEISNLVVYFRARPFKPDFHLNRGGKFNEVSSLNETKIAESYKKCRGLLQFNRTSFIRVYPYLRFNSSNFNPCPMWSYGSQLVALNYQKGGMYVILFYLWSY